VLALFRGGAEPELIAHDYGDLPETLSIHGVEPGSGARAEALVYEQPLHGLGLSSGPVRLLSGANVLGLPRRDVALVAPLVEKSLRWETVPDVTAEVYELPVRLSDHDASCSGLTHEAQTIPEAGTAELGLALSSTVALIGLRSGALFLWSEGGLDRVTIEPDVYDPLSAGAYDSISEEYWFVDRSGSVLRGTFVERNRLSVRQEGHVSPGYARYRMHLRSTEDGVELFVVNSRGRFDRFDGSRHEVLHQFSDGNFGNNVFETPEGEILAVMSGSTEIARVGKDGLVLEAVDSPAGFTSAGYLPEMGIVLGNSHGDFYVNRGDSWEELPGSPLKVFPLVLAPYRDGFLAGAAFGGIVEHDGQGFCPEVFQVAAASIMVLVPVGDAMIAVTEDAGAVSRPTLIVLR
jgi:hypothetical protein